MIVSYIDNFVASKNNKKIICQALIKEMRAGAKYFYENYTVDPEMETTLDDLLNLSDYDLVVDKFRTTYLRADNLYVYDCFFDETPNVLNKILYIYIKLKECSDELFFLQAVYGTKLSYDDEELLDLIRLVNEVKPYAVSIVDTYGLLHKNSLFHYYEMMNMYLDPSIGIGYHSHNNFQLGYANCIELMNIHRESERLLLCDGSVFGMGKGAGNAPTELLAMYMNDNFGKNYDISQLLESIDCNILNIFKQSPWGYSMKFFIAASNDCHPNYVSYLLDKKTLSVKAINDILKLLEGDKKLLYDKNYIEKLYLDYQKNECEDSLVYISLKEKLANKNVLVIGPGYTVNSEKDKITNYIRKNDPVIISINFLPTNWKTNYLFLTNSKRYIQQATSINRVINDVKIIATSNITKTNGKFDYILDYESLIDREAVFMDNSFIMLIKVLKQLNIAHIALAGLDGYSTKRESNYYTSKMEYAHDKQKGEEINAYVNKVLSDMKNEISFQFITSTIYLS